MNIKVKIVRKNKGIYKDWDFLIVHPYLDDYSKHIDDSDVYLKALSEKGNYHIYKVFHLNEEPFLGKRFLSKKIKESGLSDSWEAEFNKIIATHYSLE